MKFWLKTYKVYYRGFLEYIVAFCDEDLLGKKFEEGKLQLYVDPKFYKGELVSKEEVIRTIKNATIINAVGKNSIEILKELGLVKEEKILYIKGIPHAQVVFVYY